MTWLIGFVHIQQETDRQSSSSGWRRIQRCHSFLTGQRVPALITSSNFTQAGCKPMSTCLRYELLPTALGPSLTSLNSLKLGSLATVNNSRGLGLDMIMKLGQTWPNIDSKNSRGNLKPTLSALCRACCEPQTKPKTRPR